MVGRKRGSGKEKRWLLFRCDPSRVPDRPASRRVMTEFPAYQAPSPYARRPGRPAEPLRVRSIVAAVLVVIAALSNAVVSTALMIDWPPNATADAREATSLWSALFYLAAGIAFVTWERRARTNLDSLGAQGLRWGFGWTFGGWILPLANVVIPVLVLNEIERTSARLAARERQQGLEGWEAPDSGRLIVTLWYIFWLLDNSDVVASFLSGPTATALTVVSIVSDLAAGLLAILLVLRITANQELIRKAQSGYAWTTPGAPVYGPQAAGPSAFDDAAYQHPAPGQSQLGQPAPGQPGLTGPGQPLAALQAPGPTRNSEEWPDSQV
jgi:hypothetical protein